MERLEKAWGLRVLAIDPSKDGFAHAVLEGPDRLVDYGLVYTSDSGSKSFTKKLRALVDRFEPEVLVVESLRQTQRRDRAKALIKRTRTLAKRRSITVCDVTRAQIKQALEWNGATKQHIARACTRCFPELLLRLPPERMVFDSEDERMNIFDAVSFALTFFDRIERPDTE